MLADFVLILHALFVAFVVFGQAAILAGWLGGWAWTRARAFRIGHLAAIAYVVVESWIGIVCPLTVLENVLRREAGESVDSRGFIARWVSRLLFYDAPPWVFTAIYTLFGALVAVTYWKYPPRKKR
jgi:polyferredoxin